MGYCMTRHVGKVLFLFTILVWIRSFACAREQASWPTPNPEARPGTRWTWLGSSFNEQDIRWNMEQYARAGIGTMEITPLYGVVGNEVTERSFLSPSWMEALRFIEEEGQKDGIQIDMNSGTGWPFGGPHVSIDDAAAKVVWFDTLVCGRDCHHLDVSVRDKNEQPFARLSRVMAYATTGEKKEVRDLTKYVNGNILTAEKAHLSDTQDYRLIALYCSRTRQQVKRAAPGGEGLVIDHFDKGAVSRYLERFDKAFRESGVPYPTTFFNDSYEVYGADWTPTLFEEFRKRRGYRLEDHLPELLGLAEDDNNQVLADYRETLGDLLLENFTQQWVRWAHERGVMVRNQAHGSPANILDGYATVDIPEIEGFGLSDFGIRGLRTDKGYTRKNDSDVSMLKYASSAAHVNGKPLTSSETFTWLTEHFRTSLSQCKPDLDLMFTCGVNRVFFHTTCYSPKDEPWPGWKFYASVDMSPTNTLWRDMPFFTQYIERCQHFLQMGQPDNDFLVYLPVHDMWRKRFGKRLLMQFSIHEMGQIAPEFIREVMAIDRLGFDCDYISDRQLLACSPTDKMIRTSAGICYKGLVLPDGCTLPREVQRFVERLKKKGVSVVYGVQESELRQITRAEEMKSRFGLRYIRRRNNEGYHYFITNLTPNDVHEEIPLSVDFRSARLYHPMDGRISPAQVRDGKVRIDLRSGESVILCTYAERQQDEDIPSESLYEPYCQLKNHHWVLSFTEEAPKVNRAFDLDSLRTWEGLDDDSVRVTMGTGIYTTTLQMTEEEMKYPAWRIDLGDVRESARLYINDRFIGCAWAVPYLLDFSNPFRVGENILRIEVTNLPANRIADMDRRGVPWRRFKDANVVDINYRQTTYADWQPVASGLAGDVVLYRGKRR